MSSTNSSVGFDSIFMSFGMDRSELIINNWYKIYSKTEADRYETRNFQLTEKMLYDDKIDLVIRQIAITKDVLLYNGYKPDSKGSYSLIIDDGRICFDISSAFIGMPIVTIFLPHCKFTGFCYSVDKLQNILRVCGLLNLANTFKVRNYD